jgi:GAF domain-containing protein
VNAAYLAYFRRWGLASMVLVPLRARDRLLGLLGVSRDAAGAPYDDPDLAFAVRVGTHLSLALDNARLSPRCARSCGTASTPRRPCATRPTTTP